MSDCQIVFPRRVLERVSDRKKRRLAVDDDADVDAYAVPDPSVDTVEDSQTSMKEHRDLFGAIIPDDGWTSTATSSTKKTPASASSSKNKQNKKLPYEELFAADSPAKRPARVFVPTPRIMRIMKEAQAELYSLMGLNKSTSSDVSSASNGDLDVSGVHDLLNDSAADADVDGASILSGVVAFVDYKFDDDRSGIGIKQLLVKLGAQVEKTFNLKVTHVVFRDGYRRTYDKAIERNIPLVAARWIESCEIAKKMLDPADYPPAGIDKYTKPKLINYDLPRSLKKYEKYLRQSDLDRDNLIRIKCDNLMKEVASLDKNCRYKIVEECETPEKVVKTPGRIVETREIPNTANKPDEPSKVKDIISILSDQLCRVLNTDSPVPDEQTSELYFPVSIKVLRKYLTPNGNENKTSSELYSDLSKIENRLNLNVHARQRLRKLLFPCDKELHNMSVTSDFPSPSPVKIKISAPGRMISTKKKKTKEHRLKVDRDILGQNKNVNNKEETPQKKLGTQEVLQWRIPTDLRPNKPKKNFKLNDNDVNGTQILTRETIPGMISRSSSVIFRTPKNSMGSPCLEGSISCTGMTKCEVDTIKQHVQNLGMFTFQTKIEFSTAYVITKSKPNRTLNMVFAMAFGCFIVSEDWVHDSQKYGSWLCHEKYLISDLSNSVKEFQKRRHAFGSSLTFHIFDDVGKIYVSDSCQPPAKDLKRLVRACGGKCTSTESAANVVIGYTHRANNNIGEKWILDCITEGTLLNFSPYILTDNNSLTI